MSTRDKTLRVQKLLVSMLQHAPVTPERVTCHIISRYRCLIEEHYGKALIKLAKSFSGKDEMG